MQLIKIGYIISLHGGIVKIKDIIVAGFFSILSPTPQVTSKTLCKSHNMNHIEYDSKNNQLSICVKNKSIQSFRASHGSMGIGKNKKGDRKTPVGLYTIQKPRKSSSVWRTFIYIDYPTKAQKKKGFTGSAVGLHGPYKFFPYLNDRVNFGAGCIVVSKNNDIDAIEKHVLSLDINHIYIK